MKKLSLIILFMVCAFSANAQTYLQHLQTKEAGKGVVTVHQSTELDRLINGGSAAKSVTTPTKKSEPAAEKPVSKPANNNSPKTETTPATIVKPSASTKAKGYRVQVYAGGNSRNDKVKAQNIGNQIKAAFPDHAVYVHFYSPRWICRMGNFRTYEEAQEMLAKVKAAGFPQASLVKGQITVNN